MATMNQKSSAREMPRSVSQVLMADIFVVLGRDAQGKPHASRFAEADADVAILAAGMMGYHAVRVEEPSLRALAASLPVGRIFSNGKARVPFVKRETFDQLATLLDG